MPNISTVAKWAWLEVFDLSNSMFLVIKIGKKYLQEHAALCKCIAKERQVCAGLLSDNDNMCRVA